MSRTFILTAVAAIYGMFQPFDSAVAGELASANTLPTVEQGTQQDDRFYVVFLAHQSAENAIKYSHTFAVFARTTGGPSQQRIVETHTISWFPVSEIISLARPAEPGINKSVESSLAWAEKHGLQVTVTGPFEIEPELFHRAAERAARLNRGELKYKAFDRLSRDTAMNCIHALADIVADHGRLNSSILRGHEATLAVVRHFEPFYVHGTSVAAADLVLPSLNLERYAEPATSMVVAGR